MNTRPAANWLDFLSAEDLATAVGHTEFLDTSTLAAICEADQMSLRMGGSKRGAGLLDDDDGGSNDDDEEEAGKGAEKTGGKKSKKEVSHAAQLKACKEKARRGKINER